MVGEVFINATDVDNPLQDILFDDKFQTISKFLKIRFMLVEKPTMGHLHFSGGGSEVPVGQFLNLSTVILTHIHYFISFCFSWQRVGHWITVLIAKLSSERIFFHSSKNNTAFLFHTLISDFSMDLQILL